MELKLNVYTNQKEIEKTYTVDAYDIMTGTTEELLNMIDVDNLSKKDNNELVMELLKIVAKNFKSIYVLIHDMFGITEEEYKRTKTKELAQMLFSFILHTMHEFGKLDTKN